MFVVVMFLSIGVSLVTGGSIELMWSLANTLQILFFYAMLDLHYPPELSTVFSYMSYSNFDNPLFEYIRIEASKIFSFVHTTIPSGFGQFGFTSSSILINFLDKLIVIFIFVIFVLCVWLLYKLMKKKSNKFAEFIKRKDIDLRYEGILRFIMEILLNLCIVNLINILYGGCKDSFSCVSYCTSILFTFGILILIAYLLIYPFIYYNGICTYPDKHERHCFIFLEFKKDKQRYLYFYFFFATHRFLTAILIICVYNFPVHQCILISLLNFLILVSTVCCYKETINNFLYTFNGLILLLLSCCLCFFTSSRNPRRLKIYGYMCIGILAGFFLLNWFIVTPQIIKKIYLKCKQIRRKCCRTEEETQLDRNEKIKSKIQSVRINNDEFINNDDRNGQKKEEEKSVKIFKLKLREDGTFEETPYSQPISNSERMQEYYHAMILENWRNKKIAEKAKCNKNMNESQNEDISNKAEELKIMDFNFNITKRLKENKRESWLVKQSHKDIPNDIKEERILDAKLDYQLKRNDDSQLRNLSKDNTKEEINNSLFSNINFSFREEK